MNTHGHHDVADTAGKDALAEALRHYPANGAPRDKAFYFGNWLTDLSQVYDPVAFASVATKLDDLRGSVNGIIDKVLSNLRVRGMACSAAKTAFGLDEYIEACNAVRLESERRSLEDAGIAIKGVLHAIFHKVFVDPPGRKVYRSSFRSAVKLKAYFKFAHPAQRLEGTAFLEHPAAPMDYQSFLEIFDAHFTQYFPHEHLDRWPTEEQAWKVDGAYRARSDQAGAPLSAAPDMYVYLRDCIQIVAGKLAELDLEWARPTLSASAAKPIDDTDVEWNKRLAELGHVMHAIEDFFAHSNWVEHAVKAVDDPKRPRYLPRDTYSKELVCTLSGVSDIAESGCEAMDRYGNGETLRRRLQRLYSKTEKGETVADFERSERERTQEPHVVTGSFDFQDTAISLCHILEEILLLPALEKATGAAKNEGLEAKEAHLHNTFDTLDKQGEAAKELLRDALEFTHDPLGLSKDPRVMTVDGAGVDHENFFGKKLAELASTEQEAYQKAIAPFLGDVLPADVAGDIVDSDWFWGAVAEFLKARIPENLPERISTSFRRDSKELQEFLPDDVRKALEAALKDFSTVVITREELEAYVRTAQSGADQAIVRAMEALRLFSGFRHFVERGMTLYEAAKTIAEVFGGPVAWFRKFVREWLLQSIGAQAIEVVFHLSEAYVMDLIGSRRIGCHSLLSKDHGTEWLYPYQKSCAKAVHYYVLHTLFRWAEEGGARVCRADPGASGEQGVSLIQQHEFIDWMDLLEHFLCNPLSGLKRGVPFTLVGLDTHQVVEGETLAALERRYRPSSDQQSLTWRDIVAANFGDDAAHSRDMSAAMPGIDVDVLAVMLKGPLKDTLDGALDVPLKAGALFDIPKQVWSLPTYEQLDPKNSWFHYVFEHEYDGGVGKGKGFEDFRAGIVKKRRSFHTPLPATREDLQALASKGEELRKAAEKRYNAKAVVECQEGPAAGPSSEPDAAPTLDQVDHERLGSADLHRWYQELVQSKGHAFESSDGVMNLVGIRGFSEGRIVENKLDLYNDTIAVVWVDGGQPMCREFKASVDPGYHYTKHPIKAVAQKGCAHLVDGQYLYRFGTHKDHKALTQADAVKVWRDRDRDSSYDPDELVERGWYGINIHAGGIKSKVGPHSAGCQVIPGGWSGDAWTEFMGIVTRHSGGKTIRYTLVDSSDLQHVASPVGEYSPQCVRPPGPGVQTLLDVQRGLNHLGFVGRNSEPLIEDGVNGKNTKHAVSCFQELYGLKRDAIAGAVTRGRLQQELANAEVRAL